MPANKFCTQCGAELKGGNFCPECGAKIEAIPVTSQQPSSSAPTLPPPVKDDLKSQILSIGNDILEVKQSEENKILLKSVSESKWLLGKVNFTFEGIAKLIPEEKKVEYWDRIKKTSMGFGGDDMGYQKESYVIKGMERSGGGHGFVPSGDKYNYDFGAVRELVKSIVTKNGWKFKTTLFRPK